MTSLETVLGRIAASQEHQTEAIKQNTLVVEQASTEAHSNGRRIKLMEEQLEDLVRALGKRTEEEVELLLTVLKKAGVGTSDENTSLVKNKKETGEFALIDEHGIKHASLSKEGREKIIATAKKVIALAAMGGFGAAVKHLIDFFTSTYK